jgi:hypothetical protein
MFQFEDEKPSIEEAKSLLRKTFQDSSSDKKFLNKTDCKAAWIYLFGYKISKVKNFINLHYLLNK